MSELRTLEKSQGLSSVLGADAGGADALDLGKIDRILLAVRQHLGMEIAFVSRYVEDEEREFTHISTDLPLPHKPGLREPREDSYCWHILNGRLPELIQDAADHEFAANLPITEALPVGCHLNVPMRLKDGTAYGSFCCLSRNPDRTLTERDLEVVRAFAVLANEQLQDEMEQDLQAQSLRDSISGVIAGSKLTIVHQPIHDLAGQSPAGVECLARFPDAGERGPDAWFNDAATVGMAKELELFAVRRALETMPYVPHGHYVSINASPETILSGELLELLPDGIRDCLVIEVTEHQQVQDFTALAVALKALSSKALIAIDDVGAGYAGMRHIVDLSPDILKLDMSLTRDLHRDNARKALAGALVRFAGAIGASLVAEGIECAEEADELRAMGVAYGQGYHFSKPLPVVKAQHYLLGLPDEAFAEDEASKDIQPEQAPLRAQAGG